MTVNEICERLAWIAAVRFPPTVQNAEYTLAWLFVASVVLAITSAALIDCVMFLTTLLCVLVLMLRLATISLHIYPPDELSTFGALSQRTIGTTADTKRIQLGTVNAVLGELTPIVVQ